VKAKIVKRSVGVEERSTTDAGELGKTSSSLKQA
jgi:hypothetical protein